MSSPTHLLRTLRTKSDAEKKRITMIASGGLTVLIALFWITASLSSGTFAVTSPSAAKKTNTPSAATGLAGAGAALFVPDTSAPRLEAVSPETPTEEPKVEETPTVIPF